MKESLVVSLASVARFLLRSEAIASSRIEGVAPSPQQVALAELGGQESVRGISEQAQLVANIMTVVRDATTRLVHADEVRVDDVIELHAALLPRQPHHHGLRRVQNWIGGSDSQSSAALPVHPKRRRDSGKLSSTPEESTCVAGTSSSVHLSASCGNPDHRGQRILSEIGDARTTSPDPSLARKAPPVMVAALRDETALPAFDPAVLTALVDALQDPSATARFARAYLFMLPRRVERIQSAISANDVVAAMDAVLSLKVSSATVGARQLQALASDLETHLRGRVVVPACELASRLTAAADRARHDLEHHLELAG